MATTTKQNPYYKAPTRAATPTVAPLTDQQLGALAPAPAPVAAPVPAVAPASPLVTSVAPATPVTVPPAQSPASPATQVAATESLDPTRSALSTAAATTPTTAEQFLADFRAKQAPVKPQIQQAADFLKTITPGMPIEQQRALKAQYNQMYLALQPEDKLALLKLVQAPSSANKLAGVRYSQTVAPKSGTSTLSDEQLARLSVGQQVGAAQPQNDAEARALNTFLLQQGALTAAPTQAFVQGATANLSQPLAADRLAQQAATAQSTADEVARRTAAAVPGTNLGGGLIVGPDGTPTPGTPFQATPAQTAETAALQARTPQELALQQDREVDQRVMAQLASNQARQQATAVQGAASTFGNTPSAANARAALDPNRNPSNAAAVQRRADALQALGNKPTGRTAREIALDPNLTASQKAAEISLNSAPPSANKAAGVRNSSVIENRASTPERDAGIIALANSQRRPGTPVATTLEQARAILAANGI